jgi:sulfatase modifying factor 1
VTRRALVGLVCATTLSASMVSGQTPTSTNSVGMEFILIQPGEMVVGRFEPPYPTPADAARARRIEAMARSEYSSGFVARIERPYYIGKYEVTQAQWTRVMSHNPSTFRGEDADRHPVENVTWQDAQAFIRALNTLEKTDAYRLPSEFEWEYAARARGEADIPWTEIRDHAIAGYNAYTSTHVVGEKKPNAWGLYDMLGNVWEWVEDFYNEKLFADAAPPKSGREHVLKGGGFVADVKNAIPATHAAGPGSGFDVGFRIVRAERPERSERRSASVAQGARRGAGGPADPTR